MKTSLNSNIYLSSIKLGYNPIVIDSLCVNILSVLSSENIKTYSFNIFSNYSHSFSGLKELSRTMKISGVTYLINSNPYLIVNVCLLNKVNNRK